MDGLIYLDNAATTPVHPTVLTAILPYYETKYGNPSSVHAEGRMARRGMDEARSDLAHALGCRASEVVFTSGGTEADFSAVFGSYLAAVRSGARRLHAVTTRIEHHAVLHAFEFLAELGVEITYVAPNRQGSVSTEAVVEAMTSDTFLVSVMAVNNELGTVEPVSDIAAVCKQKRPTVIVHSDMVQALGVAPVSLRDTAIDLATFSAHKIHGPKGIGVLYVRQGTSWRAVMPGGAQERNRRAGTENVAGAVGFGTAVRLMREGWQHRIEQIALVKQRFIEGILPLADAHVQSPDDAVPSIVNVRFDGVPSDTLLMALDLAAVCASAGSACTAGSLEPSHVLQACGLSEDEVATSVRFSFSSMNTEAEAAEAAKRVRTVVNRLRG